MDNQLNSGSLNTLTLGQTLAVSARKVSGDKIHIEFAEILKKKSTSVLGEFNKSDVNFSSSARRAWVTAEPVDAKDLLGIDFGPQAEWYMSERGEMLDLNILNPVMPDGERVQLRVVETTDSTEYQLANIETSAKRAGKNGDYITHQGAYIFSNVSVVRASQFEGHIELEKDSTSELETATQEQELSSMV